MGFIKNICLPLIILLTLCSQSFAFDSGEHKLIGDEAFVKGNPSKSNDFKSVSCDDSFTYGDLVALGGDFYSTPELLILNICPFPPLPNDNKALKDCFKHEIESIEDGTYAVCDDVRLLKSKSDYVNLA